MSAAARFADGGEQAAAEHLFGPRLPLAVRYARLLAAQGVDWGVIGPREIERLWGRHLLNSAALSALVPQGAGVIDVGSGAGLPGIPLRLARPDLTLTLLEPLQRRVRFLALCLSDLRLTDTSVLGSRVEQVPAGRTADVVTARAVAPLARLVPLTWPLVRPGGQLLAVKGGNAEVELAATELPSDLAGSPDVVRQYTDDGQPLVTVVRFRRSSS